jgi:hypothetical protein
MWILPQSCHVERSETSLIIVLRDSCFRKSQRFFASLRMTQERLMKNQVKRLKTLWLLTFTGRKTGVNESENSVKPLNRSREHCRFGSYVIPAARSYLENE